MFVLASGWGLGECTLMFLREDYPCTRQEQPWHTDTRAHTKAQWAWVWIFGTFQRLSGVECANMEKGKKARRKTCGGTRHTRLSRQEGSWTDVWRSRCRQKGWCMWWREGWAQRCQSPLWSGREPCGRLSGCSWPTGGAASDGPAGCPGTWIHTDVKIISISTADTSH